MAYRNLGQFFPLWKFLPIPEEPVLPRNLLYLKRNRIGTPVATSITRKTRPFSPDRCRVLKVRPDENEGANVQTPEVKNYEK